MEAVRHYDIDIVENETCIIPQQYHIDHHVIVAQYNVMKDDIIYEAGTQIVQ